jgi:hypothetical protein
VPAGEAFTARQHDDIARAIRLAEEQGGLRLSVYVGELPGDAHVYALRLHAVLTEAAHAVLVAVDPGQRLVEIVTGPEARRQVDDRSCTLAALSMTTSFQAGDLAGGIVDGMRILGEHARTPRTLHTDPVAE